MSYTPKGIIKHMGTAVSGDDGKHWTNHHDTSLDTGGQWSDWIDGYEFVSDHIHAATWHYHITRYRASSIPSDPNQVVANAFTAIDSGSGQDVTFPERHPPSYWYYQVMLSVFQDPTGGHVVGDSSPSNPGYYLSVDGGQVLVDIGYVARTFHVPTDPVSTLPLDLTGFPYTDSEVQLSQVPATVPRSHLAAGGYIDFESDVSTFVKWATVGVPGSTPQDNHVDLNTLVASIFPDIRGSYEHDTFPIAFHVGAPLSGGGGAVTGGIADSNGYTITQSVFDGDPVPGPFVAPSSLVTNPSLGVHEITVRRSQALDATHNLVFDVSDQANSFTIYMSPALTSDRLASGYFTAGLDDQPDYDYYNYSYVILADLGNLYALAKYKTPRWRYWIPGTGEGDGEGGTITHNYYAPEFTYGVPAIRTREQLTLVGFEHQNIIKPPTFDITDTHGFWSGKAESGARASLGVLNYEAGGTGHPAESSVTFKRSPS